MIEAAAINPVEMAASAAGASMSAVAYGLETRRHC